MKHKLNIAEYLFNQGAGIDQINGTVAATALMLLCRDGGRTPPYALRPTMQWCADHGAHLGKLEVLPVSPMHLAALNSSVSSVEC